MNRFRSSTFIVVIAVLMVTGLAYAQGPDARGGFGLLDIRGLLRGLALTDTQGQRVRQFGKQYREQTRKLIRRFRQERGTRQQAVEVMPVDEARIRTAMQQVAKTQVELAILEAQLRSDIHSVLTPEQRQRAQQLRADREARMKQRREQIRKRIQERQRRQGQ